MSLNHPILWGPLMWYLLHIVALDNSNDLDNDTYLEFYNKISEVFPCDKCKFHYNKHLEKYPPPRKTELHSYLVYIHNQVRKFQKKEIIDNMTAKNLYLVSKEDEILPINHYYLSSLFQILDESPISNKIQSLIPLICKIFPCKKCRGTLLNSIHNNKINTKDLINIIQSHQLTDNEMELIKQQGFSFEIPSNNKSINKVKKSKSINKIKKIKKANKNMWKPVKIKHL